jgi:hypothetical protein
MDPSAPSDRRREPRQPVNAYGRIWYGPQYGLWADCRISDRSASGARIEIAAVYRLPRRLVFVQYGADQIFEAVLKWQRGDAAGLALTPASAITQAQPWFERILRETAALKNAGIG